MTEAPPVSFFRIKAKRMSTQPVITKSQLLEDLHSIGLSEGQTVMLHVSVKAIGWIVGGPGIVLQSILEILTASGTLMMLASWEDNPYDLSRWSEERQQSYVRECPPFDRKSSRADHREMSILAEYLRTWPGARRSRHPFSYVAVGGRADWITKDEPWQYRNGPGSPLSKLCDVNGKVLLLGPVLGNITLLHHAEHLADVPNKKIDHYKMPVLLDGKKVWMDFEEYDTTLGIVDWPDNYFETIAEEYLAKGNGRTGKVGSANAYLLDAAPLNAFGVKWMEKHFKRPTS